MNQDQLGVFLKLNIQQALLDVCKRKVAEMSRLEEVVDADRRFQNFTATTAHARGWDGNPEQLHEKVRRLERQIRLFGIAAVAVIMLIMSGGAWHQDQISTRELLLRNADGDVVAWLGNAGGGTPALAFFGSEGREGDGSHPGRFLAKARLVLLGGDLPALEMRHEAYTPTGEFASFSPAYLLMEGESGAVTINVADWAPSDEPLIVQRRSR